MTKFKVTNDNVVELWQEVDFFFKIIIIRKTIK